MPRQLKAYTLELVFSKLMFPDCVTDLILEYGCKVNDYLFVLSTPSHTIFDVVKNAYSQGMWMGKWHYGGNLAIPLYDALSLV